jgi:hypothetical protein
LSCLTFSNCWHFEKAILKTQWLGLDGLDAAPSSVLSKIRLAYRKQICTMQIMFLFLPDCWHFPVRALVLVSWRHLFSIFGIFVCRILQRDTNPLNLAFQ